MLWDTHMHTNFSTDGRAEPHAMAEAAIARGLPGICITDHLDYGYPDEPGAFQLDTAAYFPAMRQLQREYKDRLKIRIGIELGLQPQTARYNREAVQQYDFDFVIGSSHVVHGFDPYYSAYYAGKTEEEAYREYFESILENIAVYRDFDVYGHIDYVVRYGPNKNREYTYRKYADVIDAVLQRLIDLDKGLEINTAGFRYGLGHPNPTEDIIRRYRELGGEIITVGADGHAPEQVACDFERVTDILKEAGFHHYNVFCKRKAEYIDL